MSGRRAMKQRRRSLRAEALASIQSLSDAELKNLRYELGREMSVQSQVVNELRGRLDAVRLEIQRRGTNTPSGIHITDHAIVRYLQRVKNVDIEAVRAEIGDMALRARKERDGKTGRRRDPDSGLVIGVDELTTHVTTVFGDDELPVMELA